MSAIDGPLGFQFSAIVLEGADVEPFLQGQLSQDVRDLQVDQMAWSFALEPEGKLGFLLGVMRRSPTEFRLLAGQGDVEAVKQRLLRFKLRVDVTLSDAQMWHCSFPSGTPVPQEACVISKVSGQNGFIDIVTDELPASTEIVISNDPAQLNDRWLWNYNVSWDDVEVNLAPSELSDVVANRCVSFTKGCYTGQELVARMDARAATPPSILMGFKCGFPIQQGALAVTDGDVAGIVGRSYFNDSLEESHGFVSVKRKYLAQAVDSCSVDGQSVEIMPLESLTPRS
jgi:folate-binding protein YgfZ